MCFIKCLCPGTVLDHVLFFFRFIQIGYYPDLNLCMFAWEAVSTSAKVGSQCFVAIFDMNRWYNAQIPNSIRFLKCYIHLFSVAQMFVI